MYRLQYTSSVYCIVFMLSSLFSVHYVQFFFCTIPCVVHKCCSELSVICEQCSVCCCVQSTSLHSLDLLPVQFPIVHFSLQSSFRLSLCSVPVFTVSCIIFIFITYLVYNDLFLSPLNLSSVCSVQYVVSNVFGIHLVCDVCLVYCAISSVY